MNNAANFDRHTICLAAGAGLYSGANALLLIRWATQAVALGAPSFFDCLPVLIAFAVIGMFFAHPHTLHRDRGQRAMVFAGIACCVGSATLAAAAALPVVPSLSSAALLAALVLQGCQVALFSLFWGLAFATLDKGRAEHAVVGAVFVAFCLYGAGNLIPAGKLSFGVLALLQAIASAPFLAGRYPLPVIAREPVAANRIIVAPFLGSRLFFGSALGIAFAALLFSSPLHPTTAPISALLLSLASAAPLALRRNHQGRIAASLRVAPLVIAGALAIPFFGTTDLSALAVFVAPPAIFLSWFVLSSVQLSDIKERLGWNEVHLVLAERAMLFGGWTMALLIAFILFDGQAPLPLAPLVENLSAVILYVAVLAACAMTAGLIERKDRTRTVDEALKLSKNQRTIIYDEIASSFGLTPREREIFELMAKGYSRPLICETLVIAESTARSHAKHVYQKLGIHTREELYRIVELKEQRFSSERNSF